MDCNIFSKQFLQNLESELESRAKPSKALIQALKYSTNQNKVKKEQISVLEMVVSKLNKEIQDYRDQIEGLRKELQQTKQQLHETKHELKKLLKLACTEFKEESFHTPVQGIKQVGILLPAKQNKSESSESALPFHSVVLKVPSAYLQHDQIDEIEAQEEINNDMGHKKYSEKIIGEKYGKINCSKTQHHIHLGQKSKEQKSVIYSMKKSQDKDQLYYYLNENTNSNYKVG